MKIIKIIKSHSKNMTEDEIKSFLYKNMSDEMVRGLEYDDPKTINRVLKLLGIDHKVKEMESGSPEHAPLEKAAAS